MTSKPENNLSSENKEENEDFPDNLDNVDENEENGSLDGAPNAFPEKIIIEIIHRLSSQITSNDTQSIQSRQPSDFSNYGCIPKNASDISIQKTKGKKPSRSNHRLVQIIDEVLDILEDDNSLFDV